jgi:hypothetical protein
VIVVHEIPGRVRLRLPASTRSEGLREAALAVPGVLGCGWVPRTRSLVVHYDPGQTGVASIIGAVAASAGVAPAGDSAASRSRDDAGQPPAIARAVLEGVASVNRDVRGLSNGMLDLGLVVVLALGFWGIRELLRGNLGALAWSSALWYAHGLFRDYHVPASDA